MLELLLATNFPKSEVTQDLGTPAAAVRNGRSDRRLAMRVITYRSVECATDFLFHIKVQEWMSYCWPFCRSGEKLLSLTCSGYSVLACLLAMFQLYGGMLR